MIKTIEKIIKTLKKEIEKGATVTTHNATNYGTCAFCGRMHVENYFLSVIPLKEITGYKKEDDNLDSCAGEPTVNGSYFFKEEFGKLCFKKVLKSLKEEGILVYSFDELKELILVLGEVND